MSEKRDVAPDSSGQWDKARIVGVYNEVDDLPRPGRQPLRPLPLLGRRQVVLVRHLARQRLERQRPRRGVRKLN